MLRAGDASGVEHLRNGFSVMGRNNDLLNGHHISEDEVQSVNERLDHLRSEIFRRVYELRKPVP